MKRLMFLLAVLTVILAMTGCTSVSPDPGQVAVLMKKPLIFGDGGVAPTAVQPGRKFVALTTDAIYVDVVPEAHKVAFDDFASHDNIMLDLDTTVTLKITDAVTLIKNFGPQWFKNNVESPYSQMVRDIVKTKMMRDMMSNPTTAIAMDDTVTKELVAYLKDKNIPVEVISVTLGRANPTPTVLAQINETAVQQQRQLTEAAATNAEDARAAAEKARAEADSAYRLQMGYSTDQYAEMQIVTLETQACMKAKACYVVPRSSSAVIPTK